MDSIIEVDVPEIDGEWSDEFREFIKMCLKRNENDRYKINDVLHSPFLISLTNDKNLEACKSKW